MDSQFKLDLEIELYWIRHGFSCANLLQQQSTFKSYAKNVVTPDAVLASDGESQAKELNKFVNDTGLDKKIDIILCSNLRRAMETALYAFNPSTQSNELEKRILVVVPFISEERNIIAKTFNIDKENVSMGFSELKKHYEDLQKKNNNTLKIEVDFSILEEFIKDGVDISPNYDKFVDTVLPKVISKYKSQVPNLYRFAVVSHHLFIENNLNKNHDIKFKIKGYKNTEMWVEKINVKTDVKIEFRFNERKYDKPSICNEEICRVYDGGVKVQNEAVNLTRCKEYHKGFNVLENIKIGGNSFDNVNSFDKVNCPTCEIYYNAYNKYKIKYLNNKSY
jgi:broad specificity phosphatase PhoE